MTRRITQALACLFLLAFGIGVWIVFARPFESPRDKALRLCGECGLDVAEIDWLIDSSRHTTMTRAENLALFPGAVRAAGRRGLLPGLCGGGDGSGGVSQPDDLPVHAVGRERTAGFLFPASRRVFCWLSRANRVG